MNHIDLSDKMIVVDKVTGDGFELDVKTNIIGQQVFRAGAIDPEWLNLIVAAPLMYKALSTQYHYLQTLIDAMERTNSNPAIVSSLIKAQNAILISQRVALESAEVVSNAIDREPKRA